MFRSPVGQSVIKLLSNFGVRKATWVLRIGERGMLISIHISDQVTTRIYVPLIKQQADQIVLFDSPTTK